MMQAIRRTILTKSATMTRAFSSGTFYHKDLIIEKTQKPFPKPKPGTALGFGVYNTDHMLDISWTEAKGWEKPKIVPFQDFSIHPFNSTLHYALEGFEGLRIYRDSKNHIRTFRADKNAERLNNTSKALCFPTFDTKEFLKCFEELIKLDKDWVPERPSNIYVRPTIISMENRLGVHPPNATKLFIVMSPSGSYFTGGVKPQKLKVETQGVRAWPGGTGNVKLGANYAIGINFVHDAMSKGFGQVIWLNGKYISEVGAANVFIYWVNKKGEKELVTPKLDGTILPGITRDSVLQLAREDTTFKTVEKQVSIAEIVKAANEKRIMEMFMCGTAALIAPIKSALYKDFEITPKEEFGPLSKALRQRLEDIQFGAIEHPFSKVVCQM